ncbi:hypothetical protein OV450_7030 [Actinobacteria bacterium OV450]|nr:hypothetical protein OV450_7030 [Actinobacteria bacterium OV450]
MKRPAGTTPHPVRHPPARRPPARSLTPARRTRQARTPGGLAAPAPPGGTDPPPHPAAPAAPAMSRRRDNAPRPDRP